MRIALGMAIGLAAVLGVVPASFARDSRLPDQGKPAGTATEAEEPPAYRQFGNNTGVSLAVPIGSVSLGPDPTGGESVYVRRTTSGEGITIVEVSTTPFVPELRSTEFAALKVRPDQPAGW